MNERVQLEKTLKPSNVWAIALGTIIGFGCFVLPSDLLGKAGPLGATLGIVIGGIIMLIIAKSYGFMVAKFPVAGGEFAYAYQGFGRNHAYICGWFLTLGYLSIVPLNATALAVLGKFIAPELFAQGYLYTIAGYDVYIGEVLLASAAILIFGYFNYRGVKNVGTLQLLMVGLLVGAVALIGAGTVMSSGASIANLKPAFATDKGALAGILAVLAIAPWLYVGFDTIPQAAEEYDFSPNQSLRLIVLAITCGAAMYITVLLATGMVFPWQELVAAKYIWATGTAMNTSLGTIGVLFLVIAVCMGIFTGINGFYMATSRLLFGMARAKVLPQWFANVHPKYHTPSNSIIFTGLLSLLAPWFGRKVIIWVVDMAALGTAFGYMYTCFAAYFLFKSLNSTEDSEGSYSKGQGLLGGILSFCFLLLLTVPGSPGFMSAPSWYALAVWVGMGVIFYLVQSREYRLLSKKELDFLILNKSDSEDPGITPTDIPPVGM